MKHLLLEPDFSAWRLAAREALRGGYRPHEIDLQDATVPSPLTLALAPEEEPHGIAITHPTVPRAFLEAARIAAAHRDPCRWNLLYRVLYRIQTEPDLLKLEADDNVSELQRFEAEVTRDLHKMQAFLQFRKVLEPGNPAERPVVVDEPMPVSLEAYPKTVEHHLLLETPTPFGPVQSEIELCAPLEPRPDDECEHFIAWYQPDHRILPLAAPFLAERFAILRWTILTPDATASWDPISKQLSFAPGVPRDSPPSADELEALWRTYYSKAYTPPQINTDETKAEPPLLAAALSPSRTRATNMATRASNPPTAQPFIPEERTLKALDAALPGCKGCDLYRDAIQAVPGRGPGRAELMLVGEQPGDQEDKAGEPFIGPAGAMLDRILDELGIPRSAVYVTNAVKHFKFVQRGKLRLHQNPRMSEIAACRPWLLAEIEIVKPKVVLCLGANASKSLLGGAFALMRDHGKLLSTPFMDKVMATIHPSAVLRARDEESRQNLKQFLKDDLARAWHISRG